MRIRALLLTILFLAGAYGVYRVFVHTSTIMRPAVITPAMNAHRVLSPDLGARVDRLLHGQTGGDRSNRPRLIALTFDDGPYPVTTPLLLDVLAQLHVPATFFLIGRDAEQYPELTRRISLAGHEIADHTYSHPNLDQLSDAAVREELLKGAAVLHRYSADPAIDKFFRPPHGRFTEETIDVAQALHYHTILWSDDAGDWRSVPAKELADHLEQHATAPDIVLLHSGRLPTIAMLPEVVARFRKAGYRFVTVGALLRSVPAAETNHPAKHPV